MCVCEYLPLPYVRVMWSCCSRRPKQDHLTSCLSPSRIEKLFDSCDDRESIGPLCAVCHMQRTNENKHTSDLSARSMAGVMREYLHLFRVHGCVCWCARESFPSARSPVIRESWTLSWLCAMRCDAVQIYYDFWILWLRIIRVCKRYTLMYLTTTKRKKRTLQLTR